MIKRRRKGTRIVKQRSHRPSRRMDALGLKLLEDCDRILRESDILDTAVRDTISSGLARLVHSAYDCQASNMNLEFDAWTAFIETSTAQWFRTRGFAEWFCQGAAVCFNSSPPNRPERDGNCPSSSISMNSSPWFLKAVPPRDLEAYLRRVLVKKDKR